ncbi:MAG: dCTP deaminase [Candidatus Acetothermia bacterium]
MFLSIDELSDRVDGTIYEKTQFSPQGVDLTVRRIFEVTSPTELDFGGSEERPGELKEIPPEKRSPEDDYGWWDLAGGQYVVEYNESVQARDGLGIVVPLGRLTSGGSTHPPLLFRGVPESRPVLSVHGEGLTIKENARISRFMVWE